MFRVRMLLLVGITSAGCGNLEGNWSGNVDCGDAGAVDMDLDVAKASGGGYRGSGTIVGLVLQGANAGIEIKMDIEKRKASGSQTLDVGADCVLKIEGQNPQKLDCSGFDQLGWDGADEMAAKVENYMGTGYTCDIDLTR